MTAFDAETYLRMLGEHSLLNRNQQNHHRSPLELPTSVLVVAGVIDSERAERVIGDYATALRIRSGERGFLRFGAPNARRAAGKLEPRETMALNHELAFADGLLLMRDLVISTNDATIRFRWRSNAAHSRGRSRMFGSGGHVFPWGTTAPVIEDDQGNRPTVTSGGGSGNDSQWDGELGLQGPLSPTTAWLKIEGTQVELDRRISPSTKWVEPIPEQDRVERYLWRRLAVQDMPSRQEPEIGPAIDALKAAGVLSGEEPLISELKAVSAQLAGRHGSPRAAGPANAGIAIPAPWRALISRIGRSDGPSWSRVLGAVSAPFDDIQVAFHAISSDQSGFEVEFEVSPNVVQPSALGELPVVWWARDDRGNRYLGQPNGWGGNENSASGKMRFWPPLDPNARDLQLVVSADQHQAVTAIQMEPTP